MTTPVSAYAEIGITSNFSFLRGGSDPRAYVHQASELGIPVIGIADHNTLAGVVRAWKELDSEKVAHPQNFWSVPASSSSTARPTSWSIRATAPTMAGCASS